MLKMTIVWTSRLLQKSVAACLLAGLLAPAAWAEEPVDVPAPQSLIERVSSGAHEMAMNALSVIGINYRYGGNTPESGFDCSGMVRHVVRLSLIHISEPTRPY